MMRVIVVVVFKLFEEHFVLRVDDERFWVLCEELGKFSNVLAGDVADVWGGLGAENGGLIRFS